MLMSLCLLILLSQLFLCSANIWHICNYCQSVRLCLISLLVILWDALLWYICHSTSPTSTCIATQSRLTISCPLGLYCIELEKSFHFYTKFISICNIVDNSYCTDIWTVHIKESYVTSILTLAVCGIAMHPDVKTVTCFRHMNNDML